VNGKGRGVKAGGEAGVDPEHLDNTETEHHDVWMRTTITLDDEVAETLKKLAGKSGKSFKEVVNETLRLGLATGRAPARRGRFRIRAKACGFRPGIDPLRLNQLIDEMELEEVSAEASREMKIADS
jgi:Arc/MetJ family transcription regulator